MKAYPFEAPQRSVKVKIEVNFFFSSGIETEIVRTLDSLSFLLLSKRSSS